MKKRGLLFIFLVLSGVFSCYAQSARTADTVEFTPDRDFRWHVTLHHDYSHSIVGKFFLCNATYDGNLRMRDNGGKDLYMNLDEAYTAIRAMDAISLGMNKVIYLVGWQYNGHDSKYPAFFEGNTSLLRPGDKDPLESLTWLMRESRKYHTSVSLHINVTDCYDDSPLYPEYVEKDVIARDKDGKYMESAWGWGYKLSYVEEYNKGLFQKRVDSLCRILPLHEVGTIHVDAFIDHVPQYLPDKNGKTRLVCVRPMDVYHGHTVEEEAEAQRKMIKYFDEKGIDVTTEWFAEAFTGYIPLVYHYFTESLLMKYSAAQLSGGDIRKEYADLYGSNYSVEGIFNGKKKTSMEEKIADFKDKFCLYHLKRDFLNSFDRVRQINYSDGDKEVIFSDGVKSAWIDSTAYVWQNEVLLAEGKNVFLPAGWIDGKNIIAYSCDGYENREWTLPEGFPTRGKVVVTEVTEKGENEVGKVTIKKGRVTLSVRPRQMLRLRF